MSLSRRVLLSAVLPAAALPFLPARSMAAGTGQGVPLRALGNPGAKVTVEEWFSLTCTHCARFANETFGEIKEKLIDTGRIRYVFCDFPLDQIALMAAQVARSLPEDRYEPFISSLLATQDRWAFAENVNHQEQIRQLAALAGMSADQFDRAVNNIALRDAITSTMEKAEKDYNITGTPTFRFNNTVYRDGELTFASFEKKVNEAAAG
ncbi:DsbA family protein [Acetobacter sp. AN02]|uniref:thioredoxin domain-containing protein n=1 Tax=Acetobacter sp. AN02 TaxID=2894186 RepID=UPI0024345692|nr:thioredoxin domain-containing protein [Acetobacter sp. AN02]MDG6093643.1 DsbA family protein [Acetobacter sp. AN02]